MSLDFVAIDFETVSNKPGSICWAGAVKVRNGRQVDSFDCPVAPAVPRSEWNPQNMRHNHVKDEDLIGAPSWPDVLEPLREFMGGGHSRISQREKRRHIHDGKGM